MSSNLNLLKDLALFVNIYFFNELKLKPEVFQELVFTVSTFFFIKKTKKDIPCKCNLTLRYVRRLAIILMHLICSRI